MSRSTATDPSRPDADNFQSSNERFVLLKVSPSNLNLVNMEESIFPILFPLKFKNKSFGILLMLLCDTLNFTKCWYWTSNESNDVISECEISKEYKFVNVLTSPLTLIWSQPPIFNRLTFNLFCSFKQWTNISEQFGGKYVFFELHRNKTQLIQFHPVNSHILNHSIYKIRFYKMNSMRERKASWKLSFFLSTDYLMVHKRFL